MARVVITITINPDSPEADLSRIEQEAVKEVASFGGEVGKVEHEPIGFGLKAIRIIFIMDESKGSPDELEQKLSKLAGVASARVTDVRRAIG